MAAADMTEVQYLKRACNLSIRDEGCSLRHLFGLHSIGFILFN